jgi:hypothetical protein
MKKVLLVITVIFSLNVFSQGVNPVPADKVIVYFVRKASPIGAIKNFSLFDGEKMLGKVKAGQYVRYECDPGEHVFWAKSDNKAFISGELLAGKSYIFRLVPLESQVTVRVGLGQVKPSEKSKTLKLINKRAPKEFNEKDIVIWTKSKKKMMEKSMEKYKARKAKGKRLKTINKEWYYKG